MNVRSQVSMVFHLDKCIGCHTCSLACKNLWTSRPGAEYMWWNNVETKPGTGYPTLYEDQEQYRGGWEVKDGELRLKLNTRARELLNISYNPHLPALDDYYEPWTYNYGDLIDAPLQEDQPVFTPISLVTGKEMEIEAGPNWDDDLGGSGIYAANDPNLKSLNDEERERLLDVERIVYFYLPRICNHCANPSCVAACPAGAIYKRGEDGIVLVSQEKCMGWRMCVSGCPYKKVYYNWETGKSEKCILCYPRLETGQAPACMHSCVGRIRYLGVLLYDADRIHANGHAAGPRAGGCPAGNDPRSVRSGGGSPGPEGRDRRCRPRIGPKLAGVQIREEVEDCTPTAPRVPNAAHALLCTAVAACDGVHER